MSGQSSELAREAEAVKQFLKTHHNLFLWELLASYGAQVRLEALETAAQLCEKVRQVRPGGELLRGAFDGEDAEGWRDLKQHEKQLLMATAKAIRGLAARAAGQESG